MGSQSQAPSPRMSCKKWLIGIGVLLGLGLVGGFLEAIGVIDDEPAAQPTTQPPTTAASTAPATATAEPPFWPNQPTDGVWRSTLTGSTPKTSSASARSAH